MAQIGIRVLRHAAFYSPLLSALSGGFLRDEGLDPVYSIATPEHSVERGIQEGSVQVAQSAVATSFAWLDRGETPPYVHFAQINVRDGFFIAAREPAADFRWSDLQGKQVLVDHFFQPLAMFRYALAQQGVDYARLKVINAGDVASMQRAFRDGQGDYVHLQGPAPQQLQHEGLAHVVAAVGEAIGPVAFSSLCASPAWLASDMARAFMRAYRRAQQHVLQTPARQLAQEQAGFFPDIEPRVLAATIEAYQQLGCWEDRAEISPASYERTLDVFEFNGLISRRHGYAQVVSLPPGLRNEG